MAKSAAAIRRTKPEHLTRAELYRELARFAREHNKSEAARRARLPRSTYARWLKNRRIPRRAVPRAEKALRFLRRREKPRPKPIRQRDQQSVAFWAFAAGPAVVPLADQKLQRLAAAVTAGKPVTRAMAFPGSLETVRRGAWDAFQSDEMGTANAGDVFRKTFGMSEAGQQFLSDAFVRELAWLMDYSGVGLPVIPLDEMDTLPGIHEPRPKGMTYTNSMANLWSLYNYCLPLPAYGAFVDSPGFVIAWDSAINQPSVYELSVWEIAP